MKGRQYRMLATGLVFVAFQAWAFAATPVVQRPDRNPETLEVRYARTQLELAEANLQRMLQMNQQIRGAVPAEVITEYRQDVQVAKTRLQAAMDENAGIPFQAWLQRAESLARSAELQWKNALAANQRARGTVDPIDVDRLRLRSEVARLNLERGRLLVDASPEAQLQWQINVLDNEVQRLNQEVLRKPPPSRGYYPLWWY